MRNASKKMMNLLAEFLICEIGSKVVDGITYQLILKSDKTKELCNHYMQLKKEAAACGFPDSEGFRVYELSNGVIFDMDISLANAVTRKLIDSMGEEANASLEDYNAIKDRPELRRRHDMESLAKYVATEYNKGNTELAVALFSRNSSPHIMISAKNQNNEIVTEKYNAYAIRHWDIKEINEKLLIPRGIRIARMEPCEILPSRTGVKFILYIEKCV